MIKIFGLVIMSKQDWADATESYEEVSTDLAELKDASLKLRQASQSLYDNYVPEDQTFYPLDVAMGEFDEVIQTQMGF